MHNRVHRYLGAHPGASLRRRKASLRLALVSASALIAPAAWAQGATPADKLQFTYNVVGLSVFAAGILISATAALLHLSSRGKRAARERLQLARTNESVINFVTPNSPAH